MALHLFGLWGGSSALIWGDLDLDLSIRCVGSCTTKAARKSRKVARGSRRVAVYDRVK